MRGKLYNLGFSLTEVLLAVGTLAIGMLFIAGTFLAGVHFTTISTERTIAAVAADEAFAKIKLYDPNFTGLPFNRQTPLEMIPLKSGAFFPPAEFAYPSTPTNPLEKQYYWSALCRRVAPDPNRLVQVTVFVSRKTSANAKYHDPANPSNIIGYPAPVEVAVSRPPGTGNNILDINEPAMEMFINDGYRIVEDTTGDIYRVLERVESKAGLFNRIILDRPWLGGPAGLVWVVPPSFGGGRGPCIAVYQGEIPF